MENRSQYAVVVGEDNDFLIIMEISTTSEDILCLEPKRGKTKGTLYSLETLNILLHS